DGGGPVAVQAAGAPAAPTATPRPQFRVSSTVNVTLRDLNAVGPAIDGAIEAGANVAGGIQFSVDDPTPLTDQARGNAVADARRQAQLIAQAAGVTLGPPRVITEVIGSAAPQMDLAAGVARAMPAAAPAPVQGGELTFMQQIQVTYEMWP
ncbi:MAG: SIMPL domain-containing protein, partial [Anaerolineae bacterium]|nr:SIMPL domain-containing protein [Anaerolineae bacterium]